MAKFGKFMAGLCLGALVGAGVAILFAPYSGQQLRVEIDAYFKKATDDVKFAATEKRAELEKQLASLRAPKESEKPE